MSDLFWLTDAQMERIKPFFPLSHGVPRVDDKRVLSGIIFINRNGLRWRDAPAVYGPHKTLYNRWVRWSRLGVFARILIKLANEGQDTEMLMMDATHLKAHRTASSLRVKRGVQTLHRTNEGRAKLQTACRDRREGPTNPDVSQRRADQRLYRCGGTRTLAAEGRGAARGSRV